MPRFVRYHAAIPLGSFTLKNTPPMPVTCSFCDSFGLAVVSPDSRCGTAQPHTMTNGKKLARRWIRIRFMTGNGPIPPPSGCAWLVLPFRFKAIFFCDLGGRLEIYWVAFKLQLAEFHEVGDHPEGPLFERPCQLSYGDWIWNLNRHREVRLTTLLTLK